MLFGPTNINEDELLGYFNNIFKRENNTKMTLVDVLSIAEVLNDKRYYFGEALDVFKSHITPELMVRVAYEIYHECHCTMDVKDEQELLMSAKRELRETWEIKELLDRNVITVDKEKLANDFFDDARDNVQVPIDQYIKWDNELVKCLATSGDSERHKYYLLGDGNYLSARNIAWNEDRDITITHVVFDIYPQFREQFVNKNKEKEIEQPKSTKAQELSLMLESEKFEYSKSKDKNLSSRL